MDVEVEEPGSFKNTSTSPLLPSSSNNGCSSSLIDQQHETRKSWAAVASIIKSLARGAIKWVIWVVFLLWAALLFFYPLKSVKNLVQQWVSLTGNVTPFGSSGSVMMLFSGPILVIALLAALNLSLAQEEDEYYEQYVREKGCNYSIWTFPVIVDGPLGVVSAAEAVGILVFLAAVVLALVAYTSQTVADASSSSSVLTEWASMLRQEGADLGALGIICLALLFVPIARGSVLLRLINIPFENATRYHVWLGHLTMLLFSWGDDGISILPGVISLLCGLILWATTLVRRKYFEIFYYTHQLYIGFVVFMALHVSDYFFSIALGGILLFIFDRFLRFCQSRRVVDVISITSHSCGSVELVVSKPPNVKYNAMSFIFINIRELSLLQWHPFSVSNSPMDGQNHISILVKVGGDWTNEEESRHSMKVCQQKIPLTVSIEGPYGHESSYYLMYKNLVLVAGGSGISPFLAILKDVHGRAKDGRSIYPKNICIIWAIKKCSELSLLLAVDSINASLCDEINLDFQIYITQANEPIQLVESELCKNITCFINRIPKRTGLCPLVGTGDTRWSSVYTSSAIIGFVLILGIVDACYVHQSDMTTHTWFTGLMLLVCMTASVLVVGGLVAFLWHLSTPKELAIPEEQDSMDEYTDVVQQHNLAGLCKMIKYGSRPNFREIFERMDEKWGCTNVGVIVCGPSQMNSCVAREVRSHSLGRKKNQAVFHFHSHSFEL
ncbi:hypothetical protein V2J09_004019 [Rumex salicifolius]